MKNFFCLRGHELITKLYSKYLFIFIFIFLLGATLGKSVNRGIATFLAGSLGVAAHKLATFSGSNKLQPIILGLSVFSVGKYY